MNRKKATWTFWAVHIFPHEIYLLVGIHPLIDSQGYGLLASTIGTQWLVSFWNVIVLDIESSATLLLFECLDGCIVNACNLGSHLFDPASRRQLIGLDQPPRKRISLIASDRFDGEIS